MEVKLPVIEIKIFALMSILLAREMSIYEPKVFKNVGNLNCRKTFRRSVRYRLYLTGLKKHMLSPRDDETDDFQNHW